MAVSCGDFAAEQADDSTSQDRWTADWDVLSQHEAPAWILDDKIGIHFIGAPQDFNDTDYFHWARAMQRQRKLGYRGLDPHVKAHKDDFRINAIERYIYLPNPDEDIDQVLAQYKKTGARFLVSQHWGAFPGTEGLWMYPEEVQAARKQGFRVGFHYNRLRRDGLPSIGDAGYPEWCNEDLKKTVQEIEADFVFFDGDQSTAAYFKSAEFLAWYYNWADAEGKEVWTNDDHGRHPGNVRVGDVFDFEGGTSKGISPRPYVMWDILRNEWNCWVNAYGYHKRNGRKWEWQYKPADEMLQVFIDVVSKGGGWIVQMINTKQAWDNMLEIGAWLEVNGDAVYNTRPFGQPNPIFERAKPDYTRPEDRDWDKWWWQFQENHKIAKKNGPVYFTRKGEDLYAIHWGWPGEEVLIPGVSAAPSTAITMLGVNGELDWRQEGENLVIKTPDTKPCKYAYSFAIPDAAKGM
jgi:hypothetical protein